MDTRLCRICGLTLETIGHSISGGSPSFHGFEDSGERLATLPIKDLDPPGVIVPPAVADWRAHRDSIEGGQS